MTRSSEQRSVEAAVSALQRMADATDANSSQALNRARERAVAQSATPTAPRWLWATAAVAVLALAIGVGTLDRNGEEHMFLAQQPLEQQPLAEPELYEEMEFYLWLSEQLETEQAPEQ